MEPTFTPNNNNESPSASVASGLLGRLSADKASSSNPDGDASPPAPASITEEETPKEEEPGPWPGQKSFLGSEYTVENPVRDLWNEPIDYSANLFGNLWRSITLLSRVIDFFRECGVAVGTMSGRSQQPRPDRFQDLLQRQTRSFFLPQGRWSG